MFLEKFELIYDNIGIKIKTKTKRIPEYYEDDIVRESKGFEEWKVRDQNRLKKEILKE